MNDPTQRSNGRWELDKHVPIALLLAIFVQTCGAIWWAATITGRVVSLEMQQNILLPLTSNVAKIEATLTDVKEDLKELKRNTAPNAR